MVLVVTSTPIGYNINVHQPSKQMSDQKPKAQPIKKKQPFKDGDILTTEDAFNIRRYTQKP